MGVEYIVNEDGSTTTIGEIDGNKIHVHTAAGYLPPYSTRCTGEDVNYNVQLPHRGAQKSGSKCVVHVSAAADRSKPLKIDKKAVLLGDVSSVS